MIGVTGSHGFIASHLIEKLGEENVIRLNREGFVPEKLEGIIDLAAFGNLSGHKSDPRETYLANLSRIIELTHQINRTNTFEYLIYISTSSVQLPHQTYYSASKKACEEFLKVFSRDNDFPVAIIRPFTIIGIGEHEEHLIPTLIRSALTDESMPFVSKPHHDFLDVRDFVEAIIKVRDNIKDMRGEVFEVGSGISLSNLEIKNRVEKLTDTKIKVNEVESMRKYDTTEWISNNEKIARLGWKPKYDNIDTLTEMINDYARKNS